MPDRPLEGFVPSLLVTATDGFADRHQNVVPTSCLHPDDSAGTGAVGADVSTTAWIVEVGETLPARSIASTDSETKAGEVKSCDAVCDPELTAVPVVEVTVVSVVGKVDVRVALVKRYVANPPEGLGSVAAKANRRPGFDAQVEPLQ